MARLHPEEHMDPRYFAYEQRLAAYQQQRAEYEQQRVAEFEPQNLRPAEYDFRKPVGMHFDPPPFHYGIEEDGFNFGPGLPSFVSPPVDHQQLRQHDIAALQQYFGNGLPVKRPYEEVMAAPGMVPKKPRPENAARPQRPGEKECTYFMKTGECSFGPGCRFDHPAWVPPGGAPGWKENAAPAAAPALPERPGEPECTFYMRTGMCKFGVKCKFHHPRNHKPLAGMRSIDQAALKWALSEGLDPDAIFQLIRARPPLATAVSAPPRALRSYMDGQESNEFGAGAPHMGGGGLAMAAGVTRGPTGGGPYNASAPLNSRGLPMRPEEPECAFYMKSGGCKYGATCKFHHPEGVPQSGSLQSSNSLPLAFPGPGQDMHENWLAQGGRPQFPERPGQPECAFYMKTGQCKFGPTCRFHHPRRTGASAPPTSKPAAPVKLTLAGLPRREGEQACAYYMKTGACRYGPTCKFDHPPPGEAAAKAMAEQAKKETAGAAAATTDAAAATADAAATATAALEEALAPPQAPLLENAVGADPGSAQGVDGVAGEAAGEAAGVAKRGAAEERAPAVEEPVPMEATAEAPAGTGAVEVLAKVEGQLAQAAGDAA